MLIFCYASLFHLACLTLIPTVFYRFSATMVERMLSVAAFQYTFSSDAAPIESDFVQLLSITNSMFSDLYSSMFGPMENVGFLRSEITMYTALRSDLVQFDVTLYFVGEATVPELSVLEEVARMQLAPGAEYNTDYLASLTTFDSSVFGTISSVHYISTESELADVLKLSKEGDASKEGTTTEDNGPTPEKADSSVTKIVSPLAALAGLLVLGGVVIHFKRNRTAPGLDRNENLMKHTREGFDVEGGTVSGNTYRTGVFSDDGTEGSTGAFDNYRRQKVSKKLEKELEKVMDELDEVSLGDDAASTTSVTSGSHSYSGSSSDGTLVEAARAAMSAGKYLPKKSKKYDESAKPEWASRSTLKPLATKAGQPVSESIETKEAKAVPKSETSVASQIIDTPAPEENAPKMKFISASPRLVEAEPKSLASPSDGGRFKKVPESSDLISNRPITVTTAAVQDVEVKCAPKLPQVKVSESVTNELSLPELSVTASPSSASLVSKDRKSPINEVKADETSPASEATGTPAADAPQSTSVAKTSTEPEPTTPKFSNDEKPGTKTAIADTNPPTQATKADDETDDRPAWMKAQLRHVSPTPAAASTLAPQAASVSPDPEWMQKFKQMGLGKEA